jgi:hypothetical protein
MAHSIYDELVPIAHSRDLRDGINSFGPDHWVDLWEEQASLLLCDRPYHCLWPTESAVLDYLAGYRLNNTPSRIRIAADESKAYYWMKVTQTGGDHWSYVDVTRDQDSPTVEVTTNDTYPLIIGLNLGSVSIQNHVLWQPGLGLPATTYLVKGAGPDELVDYDSGYLTTQVNTTGQSTFTVSALDVDVTADPAVVSDEQAHVSTISIRVTDSTDQANPVLNGTEVQLYTTEGLFANGQKNQTLTTENGHAETTLTVQPTDDLAEITATVRQATGTATVNVVKPAIGLELTLESQTVYAGVPFNLDYRVTNTGDGTLDSVTVTDDNGVGGQTTVCLGFDLAPGESTVCQRQFRLYSSTTVHAQVSGQDPLGEVVTDNDSTSIAVIAPSIGLLSRPYPLILQEGESGNLTYQVTNTGDALLSSVRIQDNDGSGDITTVCSGITLPPGTTQTCNRPIQLPLARTLNSASIGDMVILMVTATGLDPLDNEVSVQTAATVAVGEHTYLPLMIKNH